jgi:hypothetical protein
MNRCAGCNREADRVCKHNDSLFVCTPCTKLMPPVARATRLIDESPTYCPECDERMWHGQTICTTCVDELLCAWSGLESLDNNPFVEYLVIPSIRFHQSNSLWDGATRVRDEWGYRLENGTEISFAALRESEGMMIPIEPPRCIGCDANRSRMYCSDSIPGVIMCADCQRQVTRVILGMGFDLDHPLLNELLSAEIRTWTNWDS